MTLNLENYPNTVRNSNENTVMINYIRVRTQTQTQTQTPAQPSEGFREIDYLETLDSIDKTAYLGFRSGKYCCSCCCCAPSPGIRGSICNQITKCIINLILVAGAYLISYSYMEEYKDLKDDYYIKGKEILEKFKVDPIYSSYKDYWFDYVDFDRKFLLCYFIVLALLLLFLIIEMIIYKSVIKKQKENGILQYIMIFFNGLFYIVFKIMFLIIIYDFVIFFIVLVSKPFDIEYKIEEYDGNGKREKTEFEKNWQNEENNIKYIGVGHLFLILLLFIFNLVLNTMNKTFLLYADMNYTDTNENLMNDDKSKNTSISIGGKSIDINIKKKRLCLNDFSQKRNFRFKQVFLKGITNYHINFKLGNKAVNNMLSITDWDYPEIHPIDSCIGGCLKTLYYNAYFIYLPTLFHAYSYKEYKAIKAVLDYGAKAKFAGIFKMYGNFENFVTESRLYIYLIIAILLLLIQLKRVYVGGTSRKALIMLYFILSILFIIIDVVYIILSLILSIFTILCCITIKDLKSLVGSFNIYLYIQIALNVGFPSEFFYSCKYSVLLCELLNDIRNDYNKLINNDIPEEEKKSEIKFTGQDSSQHTLKEYNVEGHPRYLYYELDNSENKEVVNNINQTVLQIDSKGEFNPKEKIPDIDNLVLDNSKN